MAYLQRKSFLKIIPTRNLGFLSRRKSENVPEKVAISKIIRFGKPVVIPLISSWTLLGVSTGVTMTIPKKIGQLLDYSVNPDLLALIDPLVLQMSGLIVLGAIANASRLYLQAYSSEGIQKYLRQKTYANLVNQPPSYYDKQNVSSAEIISRMTSDTQVLGKGIAEQSSGFLRSGAQLTIGLSMAYSISPDLLLYASPLLIPTIAIASILGNEVAKYSNLTQKRLSESSKITNETLGVGLKTVQVFQKEQYEISRFSKAVQRVNLSAMTEAKYRSMMFGFNGLAGNAGILARFLKIDVHKLFKNMTIKFV